MAMIHNRIIAGPPEAMIKLLQIPARFPDATRSHIENWQESLIAWWRHPKKHKLMISSFTHISPEKMASLKKWVKLRTKDRSEKKGKTLDEIETSLLTFVMK